MKDLKPINENKDDELLKLLLPLVDFMDKNDFSYFFVAGKDGKCSRYMKGKNVDLIPMLTGMAESNKSVEHILRTSIEEMN